MAFGISKIYLALAAQIKINYSLMTFESYFWKVAKELNIKILETHEFNVFDLNMWEFEEKTSLDGTYESELFFNKF